MDLFSEKLRLIYVKLFDENIDAFTEALLDHNKFEKTKFDLGSESEKRQKFFLNRKTVLRRWLKKGTNCTPDFQKSFNHYPLAQLELEGSPLFTLSAFKSNDNLEAFNQKIEKYLKKQKRVYLKTDYQYIYSYCEVHQEIYFYKIIEWLKGDHNQTLIRVQRNEKQYKGLFSLSENNNIFISLKIDNATRYFLFHELNDTSCAYTIGMSMGYLKEDNIVPRSQKVIFAKKELDIQTLELNFTLNQTEVLTAVENRLNLNAQIIDEKVNYFSKYAHVLKKYFNFFNLLGENQYRQRFYYRLAFQEFSAIRKIFKKIAKKESYYIFDYTEAFLVLLKTIENIKGISFQVVMQLNDENLLARPNIQSMEIKKRLLNLYTTSDIKTTIIFVTQEAQPMSERNHALLQEMQEHHIKVRLIHQERIANSVNSLDFSFIHLNDERDFVLADPIRDSKDVYKLFIDTLTMDEYKTDYQKFLLKSTPYKKG